MNKIIVTAFSDYLQPPADRKLTVRRRIAAIIVFRSLYQTQYAITDTQTDQVPLTSIVLLVYSL